MNEGSSLLGPSPNSSSKSITYIKYPSRVLIMVLLSMSSSMNGYLQATFVSIWQLSVEFFSVDALSINMFSVVFMIFFIPGCFGSVFVSEKYGVSSCILAGAFMNTIACWVRFVGSSLIHSDQAYGIVLFGQIIAAIGAPFLINSASRIANDWFPADERNMAMFVMIQSWSIGTGLGTLIPAYQVHSTSDFPRILLWQAIAASGILALTAPIITDRPPSPPGRDVEMQIALLNKHRPTHCQHVIYKFLNDFKTMLSKPNFLFMFAAFSFGVGVNWSYSVLVGQVLNPCGYTAAQVGVTGSVMQFVGVFGSFSCVLLLWQFAKHHLSILQCLFAASVAALLFVISSNRPHAFPFVVVSWALFGLTQGPLVPLSLEQAVEIAYPVAADSVAALMFIGSMGVTLPVVLTLTPLLTLPPSTHCSTVITPAAILAVAVAGLALLFVLCVRKESNRSDSIFT